VSCEFRGELTIPEGEDECRPAGKGRLLTPPGSLREGIGNT